MFDKDLKQLTYEDIHDLVKVRQEREGYHLDFKKEIGNPDKAKLEMAKDISAFANSYGGYLLIGITNDLQIIGIDPTIQNKGVDEWLNQILGTNIEPQVYYPDPKVISIPGSEKVVVVVYVPESSRKPHMTTESNRYHIRVNDIAKPANHGQVRDMFEFSRNRAKDVETFLAKRKILDEDAPDFCMTEKVKQLKGHAIDKRVGPKPIILFSIIPNHLNEKKLNIPAAEFTQWLRQKSVGYDPISYKYLFNANGHTTINLNGFLINKTEHEGITSYVEILDNGFIEAAFSKGLTYPYDDKNQPRLYFYLTQTIAYEMALLGFVRKFYELTKYKDEAVLQISFANMLGCDLSGFHDNYYNQLASTRSRYTNTQHERFKLSQTVSLNKLTDEHILTIGKDHAEKICRAFGLSRDLAFVDDKLGQREMNNTWF